MEIWYASVCQHFNFKGNLPEVQRNPILLYCLQSIELTMFFSFKCHFFFGAPAERMGQGCGGFTRRVITVWQCLGLAVKCARLVQGGPFNL